MLEILRAIEACGLREVAKPMLQRPLPVLQYEIMTGRCSRNPAADLDAETVLKKGPEVQHMAGVKTVDIPQFMRDIDAYSGNCIGYKSRTTSHGFRELAPTVLREWEYSRNVVDRESTRAERNQVTAVDVHAEYLPDRKLHRLGGPTRLPAVVSPERRFTSDTLRAIIEFERRQKSWPQLAEL